VGIGITALPVSRAIGFVQQWRGKLQPPGPTGPMPFAEGDMVFPGRGWTGSDLTITAWLPSGPGDRASLPGDCGQALRLAAPPASGPPLPVVVYVPSWGQPRSEVQPTARDLASHGYVVLSIDDIVHDRYDAPQSAADEDVRLTPFDFSSDEAADRTIARSQARARREADKALAAYDAFVGCVAATPAWQGRVEANRLAVVGFSFGGATAAAARSDPRVVASVNLDGWTFGYAGGSTSPVPHLQMYDGEREMPGAAELTAKDPSVRRPAQQTKSDLEGGVRLTRETGGRLVMLPRTIHEIYSGWGLAPQLARQWLEVDPVKLRKGILDYVRAFLDETMKGRKGELDRVRKTLPDGFLFLDS
jgi:dienelactone hydrolase